MADSNYKHYIQDIIPIIKERALEAKKEYLKNKSDFNSGIVMGYVGILLLLKNQAEVFEIPLKELVLDNFDPEASLLDLK